MRHDIQSPWQQAVQMPRMCLPLAGTRLAFYLILFNDGNSFEVIAQSTGGHQAADAGTEYNGLPTVWVIAGVFHSCGIQVLELV